MTILSLALLALQSSTGLPPGAEVQTLHRFQAEGTYLPNQQVSTADATHTYLLTSAETVGARSWTRTQLDHQGAVVWSHTDYQVAESNSSVGRWSSAVLASGAGLLLAGRLDARSGGTFQVVAYRLSDGGEAWSLDLAANPDPSSGWFEEFYALELHEPTGVVHVLSRRFDVGYLRTVDLQTGACVGSPGCVQTIDFQPFGGLFILDVELSADGQRLYLAGRSSAQAGTSLIKGTAMALDVSSGAELWRTTEPDQPIVHVEEEPGSTRVLLLSAVSIGSQDTSNGGRLWSVDGAIGSEFWSQTLPAHRQYPGGLEFTGDGSGLIVAWNHTDPGNLLPLSLGGVLERFSSANGQSLWQRVAPPYTQFSSGQTLGPHLSVGAGGLGVWSYGTTEGTPIFGLPSTAALEGFDLMTGQPVFNQEVAGQIYSGIQSVGSSDEFIYTDFDSSANPFGSVTLTIEASTLKRASESNGNVTFGFKEQVSGPIGSFAVNFEATDDASLAGMMRYVEDAEPRLEIVWLDLETGTELWVDVLTDAAGLDISGGFEDRNREMLLSPDDSVLVSAVRGDAGSSYSLRLRAYDVATGQLLWSESFSKQIGAVLEGEGMTRPGLRGIEVTNEEVLLTGNANAVGGMLLASRGLLDGVANWTLLSGPGVTGYINSSCIALDGDSVYAALEAPQGALQDEARRIVRVDRITGAILGTFDIDTEGYIATLLAKGEGEPLLVTDQTSLGIGGLIGDSRLLTSDLGSIVAEFPGASGGRALTPGEGYLIGGAIQGGDVASAGEVNIDVHLAAVLEAAPGGVPFTVDVLDRGQLAFDLLTVNPVSGEPEPFLRLWDATDGAFMWAGPLFGGLLPAFSEVVHLEQLPGRAGFIGAEAASQVAAPAPQTSAPSPVVQIIDLPELIVEPREVSLSGGTQLDYWLRRNAEATGPQAYFLLGGLDEVANGPLIDGLQMPFAATDAYTLLTLTQANQGNFVNTLGLLDEFGNARARIDSPAGLDPALLGETFHYAWLTVDLALFPVVSDVSHTVQTLKLP